MTPRWLQPWGQGRIRLDEVGRGDRRYPRFIDVLRSIETDLWRDAEHRVVEHRAKHWWVVWCDGAPAAWCAMQVVDGVAHCTDGYERRGPGREYGLHELAYGSRQAMLDSRRLNAITHLFEDPATLIPMYERGGWYRTGVAGPGELPGHVWAQLRRRVGGVAA